MDTETKMANCPEIQDGWEPKVGDMTNKGIVTGFDHTRCFIMRGVDIGRWYRKDKVIFKPRQGQLQEMLGGNHPQTLYLLFRWLKDKWGNAVEIFFTDLMIQFTSMEQLWLAFVMHELHGKTWDEEKWIERG